MISAEIHTKLIMYKGQFPQEYNQQSFFLPLTTTSTKIYINKLKNYL